MTSGLEERPVLSPVKRAYLALEEARAKLAAIEASRTEPIAVVGMGCRFPGGADDPERYWRLLRDGVDAIREVPADRWDVDRLYDPDPLTPGKMTTRWGGFLDQVDRFDAAFFNISPAEARDIDPQQRLLLEVAWEALEHGGIAPETIAGSRAGVFLGVSTIDYALLRARDLHGIGPFATAGSAHSIFAGRLAYLFDLRGPSLAVDTACSSSLVALHLACESLRSRESELALVGGVNVLVSPANTIGASKMRIMAPDGRCKTFDAAADGYVRGEGCGVVVLRRLSDARARGDRILALIRGSAVNQDGRGAGLTAPNGVAQQAVIREALARAGVTPAEIDFVEAHGTGTALGDPIELEALAGVLGPRASDRRCVVGSVKTNFGHLEAAAGMAALIKAVLVLDKQAIPPHLHLRELNPHLAGKQLPFEIPTELRPWPRNGTRRCAGVSSMSFAGTNVHVVLEEAPDDLSAGEPSRPSQLLVLSARSSEALEAATDNLAARLEAEPGLDLPDVAYTLQVGRRTFAHCRALVCTDAADAAGALRRRDPARLLGGIRPSGHRPIVFMLSGVGDHYAGMTAGLYASEPTFRRHVDECSAALVPHLGFDLRTRLFGEAGAAPGTAPETGLDLRAMVKRHSAPDGGGEPLTDTDTLQPATFVIAYALARLWRSWGIEPDALIGHSIGEYVAACLAGVFELDAALALVARRAQLIHDAPPGGMLAVSLPEEDVQRLLAGRPLSLSAVNAPSLCVVSGAPEAVAELETALAEMGVLHRRLATTRAYHSAMMEPLAAELAALVAALRPKPPTIPYVSNLTGTWIRPEEAVSPHYWARHLHQPVRFADGVASLWRDPSRILLEVGPGQSLCAFAMQQPIGDATPSRVVVASVRQAYDRQPDGAYLLGALARLWLAGGRVDWHGLHGGARRRLALPTYPFQRQPYWIDGARAPADEPPLPVSVAKKADIASWFHVPVWKQRHRVRRVPGGAAVAEPACWVLFLDACGLGRELEERLRLEGADVVTVAPGEKFSSVGDRYTIDPRARDDYDLLLRRLLESGRRPGVILHLWSVAPRSPAVPSLEELDVQHHLGFLSLLFLAQALTDRVDSAPVRLAVVSSDLFDVLGDEPVRVGQATILGPCRVIPLEHPRISCRTIDVVLPPADDAARVRLIEALLAEARDDTADALVAYRGGHRWVRALEPVALQAPVEPCPPLREGGVYLITGGLGGLGLAMAEQVARTVRARLVLVGRSGLPDRAVWDEWAVTHAGDPLIEKLERVRALERQGAEVMVVAADVSDPLAMRSAVERVHARFGRVNGVIHAAGVAGSGLLALKTPEMAAAVLAAKVSGTLVLDALLAGDALDFFAMFSSIIAITGAVGGLDYCAANAFLDAFAHARAGRSTTRFVAINWGGWQWDPFQDDNLAALPETQMMARQLREQVGITFEEGGEALRRILAQDLPQVVVLTQEFDVVAAQLETLTELTVRQRLRPAGPRHPRPPLPTPYVAPRSDVERRVAEIWQDGLGVDQVGMLDNFLELGGHSLLAMQIRARVLQEFDVDVPIARLFAEPTVANLAAAVAEGRGSAGCERIEPAGFGAEEEALLGRIDQLSDEEVDSALHRILGNPSEGAQ